METRRKNPPHGRRNEGPTAVASGRRIRRDLVGLCVVGFCLVLNLQRAKAAPRRVAVVVGNDTGGPGTSPLLYARQDARRMHDTLIRLGGVKPQDAHLLLGEGRDDVWKALRKAEADLKGMAKQDTALLFYFSGHAKDGKLHLGDTQLDLKAVRDFLRTSTAGVRVGMIDSCRSGSVNRRKGARRAPAFEVESTQGVTSTGTVLLTSSSFDEDSQESDHIGGSYFSHHLINALQGAADNSGDGRVTLSEAYAYTYAKTVADTAASAAGPQHPTFFYDLKGNGDFVLSLYGQSREGLLLPARAPGGSYFLLDGQGVVRAEVSKTVGQERRVALKAGRYTVKRRLKDRLRIGPVIIAQNQITTLHESTLQDAPFRDDPVKGTAGRLHTQYNLSMGPTAQSFFQSPGGQTLFPGAGLVSLEFTAADFLRRHWWLAFDIAAGGGQGQLTLPAGQNLSFNMSQIGLGTSVLPSWVLRDGDLLPYVGVRLAFMLLTRRFEQDNFAPQFFSSFSPGVVAGLRHRLTGRWWLVGRGRLNYLHYNVDDNLSLGFWDVTAAVAYDF